MANLDLLVSRMGLGPLLRYDDSRCHCYINAIEIGNALVEVSTGDFVACWI